MSITVLEAVGYAATVLQQSCNRAAIESPDVSITVFEAVG
jgi:hypothetical protein